MANGFSELRKDLEFVISKGSQDEKLYLQEVLRCACWSSMSARLLRCSSVVDGM